MNEIDLHLMAEKFFRHLKILNYSSVTIEVHRRQLSYFLKWANQRGIETILEVDRAVVEDYQKYLYYYRKKNDEPLKNNSQRERLQLVKNFFHWLAKHRHLPFNPAGEIELPLQEKHIPKAVLSVEEVEKLLRQPVIADPFGLRNRAILETFYSTGVRRRELRALTKYDLDPEKGTLMVRQGKGKKDRLIPIGERALLWIEKYLQEVRPTLVKDLDPGHLFLSAKGGPLSPGQLSQIVRKYLQAAGIDKQGSCHMLRHTMATLMLEGGAELCYIQQMLGHEAITSTQIYTKISIKKLQEVHKQTHPAQVNTLKNRLKDLEEQE